MLTLVLISAKIMSTTLRMVSPTDKPIKRNYRQRRDIDSSKDDDGSPRRHSKSNTKTTVSNKRKAPTEPLKPLSYDSDEEDFTRKLQRRKIEKKQKMSLPNTGTTRIIVLQTPSKTNDEMEKGPTEATIPYDIRTHKVEEFDNNSEVAGPSNAHSVNGGTDEAMSIDGLNADQTPVDDSLQLGDWLEAAEKHEYIEDPEHVKKAKKMFLYDPPHRQKHSRSPDNRSDKRSSHKSRHSKHEHKHHHKHSRRHQRRTTRSRSTDSESDDESRRRKPRSRTPSKDRHHRRRSIAGVSHKHTTLEDIAYGDRHNRNQQSSSSGLRQQWDLPPPTSTQYDTPTTTTQHIRIDPFNDSNHSSTPSTSGSAPSPVYNRFTPFFTNKYVFSNHYLCNLTIDNRQFRCTEQYYMWVKAKTFGDEIAAEKILNSTDPKEMKSVGSNSNIRNFNADIWSMPGRQAMILANYQKYKQNRKLRLELFRTIGTTLVECNPYDDRWGIAIPLNDPRVHDPQQWRGQNWMGEILTRLRDAMMESELWQEDAEYIRRQHRRLTM